MDLEKLEEWVKSEDGLNWLESKKDGLKNKNKELLAEVKKLHEQLNGATENNNVVSEKYNNLEMTLKNDYIQKIFQQGNVFPECNNYVLSEIEKLALVDGGFTSENDNGNFVMKTKEGKTFSDYFEEWKNTDLAGRFIKVNFQGGGATGSDNRRSIDFSNMTAEDISKSLNTAEGRTQIQNALTNRSI